MLKKYVKLKEQSFQYGSEFSNNLAQELKNYESTIINQNLNEKSVGLGISEIAHEKFIGLNPITITKFIYNSSNFRQYLKYAFIGKYYAKKIDFFKTCIIILFIILGFISYLIFKLNLFFIISVVILIVILLFILKKIDSGESYDSFYDRTFLSLLCNSFYNIKFNLNNITTIPDEEVQEIYDKQFDKKKFYNNINFESSLSTGNILDLQLTKIIETRDKAGNRRKTEEKIFDGFYLKIELLNRNIGRLKENKIKIRADESLFSSITEDTFKGIYEGEKEISFNAEEMNKSFDGKITGYSGFNDVDEALREVNKIITPSFEQHLLYLRERYNSFNLNISDNSLVASFNMNRTIFQKIKHDELLDFKTTYREANEKFRMLKSDLSGINDFVYYNVFPFMERLYLINYLTYLYFSYMEFENYYSVNNDEINKFEEEMKSIFTMNNKEFKELYTEEIKEIKKNTKEEVKLFEEKEKKTWNQ